MGISREAEIPVLAENVTNVCEHVKCFDMVFRRSSASKRPEKYIRSGELVRVSHALGPSATLVEQYLVILQKLDLHVPNGFWNLMCIATFFVAADVREWYTHLSGSAMKTSPAE